MHTLAAEFQDVLRLYVKLAEDLAGIVDVDEAKDPQALVKSILNNRECLTQIQAVNARILRLYGIWEKGQGSYDPATCEEIRGYAQAAKAHALRLQDMCGIQAQRVQLRRDQLAKQIQEIGNGARYLKMLNPVQTNYPKFIDSAY